MSGTRRFSGVRTKSQKTAAIRQQATPRRPSRQRLFESLETKALRTGVPQLIEINALGASSPSDFLQIGEITYFVADDGILGRELWRTDGTSAGTALVKDIQLGVGASTPTGLVNLNGVLYFSANDGVHGEELWKSDGTSDGTLLVRDINAGAASSTPREMTAYNGSIFFSAHDSNGKELWRSDGTDQGTTLVNDLFSGTGTYGVNSSNPRHFALANGSLYFSALGADGLELWKSDGTTSGTMQVKDIYTGTYSYYDYGVYPNSANPTQLTNINGTLYFAATSAESGTELWKSDGTDAGTVVVKDIHVGSTNQDGYGVIGNPSSPHLLTSLAGTMYFVADDGTNGAELWKSDGTAAGTVLVADITPGSAGGMFETTSIVVGGNTMYFTANDGVHGFELWKSDGTAAGTVMVSDIEAGANSSNPADLTVFHGLLYFSATTIVSGAELWLSNGTSSGTALVAETAFGTNGITPTALATAAGGLVFSGDLGSNRELYTLSETEVTTGSINLSLFVNGQQITLPANIGVNGDGTKAGAYTTNATGKVFFDSSGGLQTLGSFFTTWRTAAGLAGNYANAFFDGTQLLGNLVDRTHSLQIFVNGHLSTAADEQTLHDGDQISLVYGADPVVSLNTNFGSILVELYATQTPGTVANFLNYVNGGDYLNSFFHRSVNNFVIQGGGFTTTSPTFTSTGQFSEIPTNPPIANEPGISNLRGTIAMAKLGGDPNSATSQFFVNLSDSNTVLDSAANNAFTVFGKILGMTAVDAIAALPISNLNASPYDELPLSASNQLAVIQSLEGEGTISGFEFGDTNANGIFDSGDAPIAGATVYLDVNGNGAFDGGDLSTLTLADGSYFFHVAPGNYTVRSLGVGGLGVPTPAGRSATVEIGRETSGLNFAELTLDAPTAVVLATVSDTGASGDAVTRLNNSTPTKVLQFTVFGVTAGAQVYLYAGATLIGSATATSNQLSVATDGTTALADGLSEITAVQSLSGVQSEASTPLSITVDTVAPAAFTSTPPAIAQVGQTLRYDANTPDETLPDMTYSLSGAPAGMTIDTSGVITWLPATGQAVPQHLQVRIADVAGNEVVQAIDLTVLGVIPAYPDEYQADEDTPLTIGNAAGVLANDGSETAGELTAAVVDQPNHGTLTLNADGTFTYTPNSNFFGVDRFTYIATNGDDTTNIAEVTISVIAQNDSPLGVADTYTTTEDVVLTVSVAAGVLDNDTDVDGDSLSAVVAVGPGHGTLSLAADGSFVYEPSSQYSGEDSFTYMLGDATTTVGPITVTLHVTAVNDPPTAVADTYNFNEDTTLTIGASSGVLANDSDPDSSSLTALLVSTTAHGALSLAGDGSFTYMPNNNFFGTDSFTYAVSDGAGQSQTVTATITVLGQPDPPSAVSDSASAPNDGTAQVIHVLANDTSEPDGTQTLTIVAITQGTAGGIVAIRDNAISYTGPVGFTGTDTFTYTVQDTDGLTSTGSVTVSVADARNSSIAGYVYIDANGNASRETGESGVPGVMITLTGADNQGASVTREAITDSSGLFRFNDLKAGTYQLVEQQPAALMDGAESTPIAGAMVGSDQITNIVLAGGVDFTESNFGEAGLRPQYISVLWFLASRPADATLLRNSVARGEELAGNTDLAAAIRAGDTSMPSSASVAAAAGAVALAAVDVVDDAPVGCSDSYELNQDATLAISAALGLLANDVNSESVALASVLETRPTSGVLSLQDDGSFTYTPQNGFSGSDSFTYRVSDGRQSSSPVTVSLAIHAQGAGTLPLLADLADEAFSAEDDWLL